MSVNTQIESVPEVEPQAEPVVSVDELLSYTSEKNPLFVDDANYKGMAPLHELMKVLPEDAKKQLANIRADYTRKQQALAESKKELESLRAQVEQEKKLIAERLSQYQPVDTQGLDPWSEEGQQKLIEAKVQERLAAAFQPIKEQLQAEEVRRAAEATVAKYPDLKTDGELKLGVAKLLIERPELTTEDAYHITKSRLSAERGQAAQQAALAQKQGQRATLSHVAKGSSAAQSMPDFKDARTGKTDHVAMMRYLASQKK